MAEKPLPWFRGYPEAAFDPKFDVAALQTGMDALLIFGAWWKILCIAGASPIRGSLYVTAMKRYSNGDVAAMLRLCNDDCNKLLNVFTELEMLDTDPDGAYHVKNWEKRQFESDKSTGRVKKHREKQKKQGCNADETLQDRFGNGNETPPDTDPDNRLKREGASAPLPEAKKGKNIGRNGKPLVSDPLWQIPHGETPTEPEGKQPPDLEWCANAPDVQELAAVFQIETCLPVPFDDSTRGYWISGFRELARYGVSPGDLRNAICTMRDTNTFIKSPESCKAIALDLMAKQKGSGNGKPRLLPDGV